MVLTKRIIPCLDVTTISGIVRVVKGISFINLRDAGDPVELGAFYDGEGADELVFLDITASSDKRSILIDMVESVGDQVFIPFTVGGGIRTTKDIKNILRAGADKISVNTAAVKNPDLVKEGAKIFGSQCIVTAIDAKRVYVDAPEDAPDNIVVAVGNRLCWWEVYIHGGRTPTKTDAILWGEKTTQLGSGEILLTSMDQDGRKTGYDIELTRSFSERLDVPIIASGGAGSPRDFIDVFKLGKADAALAASIFHYNEFPIQKVKENCKESGIPMRF